MNDAPPPWPPHGQAPPPGWPQQQGHPPPQPGVYGQAQPGAYGQPQPGMHGQAQPGAYGQPQPGPYGQPQPGMHGQAQPRAYGQPQPGAYGQPQPGMHGQAQPGAYGQSQPGPYGQAPPGAYGQAPQAGFGQPPSPWAQVPHYAPPKPKAANNHLKIIGGLGLTLVMGMTLLINAHKGFDSAADFGATLFFTVLLGASLLLLLKGIFGAAKREGSMAVLLGVPVGVGLLSLGVGPFVSTAFCEHEEARRWAELEDAMSSDPLFFPGRWTVEYAGKIDPKFQRKEWRGRWMLARAKEEIDRKNAGELRRILEEIAESGEPALYADAEQAASQAFTEYYEAAKTKLYAPAAAGSAREFAVDEALRGAFGVVLEELTHTPTAEVHVAFANSVDLTPPEGTEELLVLYQADPQAKADFPDGAPVIEPQQSFSPAYDSRRRRTFMAAMSESFGQVFDANLLSLVPLEDGQSREGKIVIEVRSHIVRLPKFFFWEKERPGGAGPGDMHVAGLLFGIAVDWELKVFGRDGKELYAQPSIRSEPAGTVSVSTQPGDPDWGMYSVLMDSAYYNYARQVTGMFGLVPPPEKTVLAYQGA